MLLLITNSEKSTLHNRSASSRRNKLFPFVYENQHNYFVRNNIKMQKKLDSVKIPTTKIKKMYDDQENLKLSIGNSYSECRLIAETNTTPFNFTTNINSYNSTRNKIDLSKYHIHNKTLQYNNSCTNDAQQTRSNHNSTSNFRTIMEKAFINSKDNDGPAELNKCIQTSLFQNEELAFMNERRTIKRKINLNPLNTILKRKTVKSVDYAHTNGDVNLHNLHNLSPIPKAKKIKQIANKVSSFDLKLTNELTRVSPGFSKSEAMMKLTESPLMNKHFDHVPDYQQYKKLKIMEIRKKDKHKAKIAPLIVFNKKSKLDDIGSQVYNLHRQSV